MNSPVRQPLNKNNGSSLHIEDNELLTGIQRATSQNLGLCMQARDMQWNKEEPQDV